VQQSEEVRKSAAGPKVEPAEHGPAPDPFADQLAPADWAAADEMRRRTFSVAEQGYDQEEVRGYLSHLAEVFAHQASKLSELRRAEVASPGQGGGEDPSGLASKIAEVLKEAEEHAARLREEAEGEAKLLLAGAHQRAEQAERDGEQIAAAARREVEQEAERKVSAAERRAEEAEAEARRAVAEAKRRATDAEAVRDAVVAEVQSAWQRVSQVVAVPAEALETPSAEPAVHTPPAPQPPA
jgi:hypothetical protein